MNKVDTAMLLKQERRKKTAEAFSKIQTKVHLQCLRKKKERTITKKELVFTVGFFFFSHMRHCNIKS